MMTPACRDATIVSGTCAVSHLINGSPMAKQRLAPYRVQLQKELQRRANVAAAAENRAVEREFQDWARVILDGLGGHKLGGIDEDAGDPPVPILEEEEEKGEEDVFGGFKKDKKAKKK